jgi:hypothetical protein
VLRKERGGSGMGRGRVPDRGAGEGSGAASNGRALVGWRGHACDVEKGRARVGLSEERKTGRAQRNRGIFNLFKRISKGSDLIRLKDDFLNSQNIK